MRMTVATGSVSCGSKSTPRTPSGRGEYSSSMPSSTRKEDCASRHRWQRMWSEHIMSQQDIPDETSCGPSYDIDVRSHHKQEPRDCAEKCQDSASSAKQRRS